MLYTRNSNNFTQVVCACMKWSQWFLSTNLAGHRFHCGHVTVHSCRVHRETVETVEETCDWALTVTSRSLWTTSAQRWCRLFPLHWQLPWSKVERQDLRTWRPMSPTETRSALVWRSYVMTGRCSLNNSLLLYITPVDRLFKQIFNCT